MTIEEEIKNNLLKECRLNGAKWAAKRQYPDGYTESPEDLEKIRMNYIKQIMYEHECCDIIAGKRS